ncbi:iron ABC transporter permease [Gordoniibacillus kamchatkensis]|uniref:Iron ABC transporter permease n=1 Tax=Gordoniibacillus kamchatkensis TaxID=1590651 RepID=A0ABR5AAZ5_9BACL|nr:iron ABC transporter permease [Paenibacillus sp. VKM B-2647]
MPASALLDKRAVLAAIVLAAAIILMVLFSAGIGTMRIHPLDVLKVFAGQGQEVHKTVVFQFRLPRIALSLLVGASLAASGAIVQGMIRNPLASPDLVGITNGAAVAATSLIALTGGAASVRWLPLAAICGAAAAALLIYVLAWKRGVTPLRLVLVGIGLSSALSAITSVMVIASPLRIAGQALVWLTGSVYGAAWSGVLTLLPWTAAGLALAFVLARQVSAQQLGDDIAVGLGSRLQLQRLALLALSVALAGSAVALAGGIAFIGLMAPHMARRLVGPAFGAALPVAALCGGLLMLAADLAARTVFMPTEIPAGVFTAAIGAPFFIYLLRRRRSSP